MTEDKLGVLRCPESEPYGGYDFSKPSRAVVVCGAGDHCALLYWVGGHIAIEVDECCVTDPIDIGLAPENHGIWVWEGKGHWTPGPYEYPEDGDYWLDGSFREPTKEEWASIQRNECPWDDEDWKLK